MSENEPLPPPPEGDLVRWLNENPEAFSAYLRRVYALSNFEIVVVVDGQTRKFPVLFSATNATVEINLD